MVIYQENSSFDPNCRVMMRAIQTQLASQHKNRQYKFHIHYKKFSTKEEAIRYPPNGIKPHDWVSLCEQFASENFQVLISLPILQFYYIVDEKLFRF